MYRIKIICLFICIFAIKQLCSQIYSPAANYTDYTNYETTSLGKHPIYIYSTDKGDYNPQVYLNAKFADSTNLNFYWLKFDYKSLQFKDTVQIDKQVSASKYLSEGEGGYKVHILGNKVDTTFYAWVYISTFQIISVNIKTSTCDFMKLQTTLNFDNSFLYYDLKSLKPLTKQHNYTIEGWESSPSEITIPRTLNPMIDAPTKYMRFNLTMKDNFEQERTAYLDIKEAEQDDGKVYLVATKANFKSARASTPKNESDSSGQAPLKIQFENLSENAVNYKWTFFNETSRINEGADSIFYVSDFETPIDSIVYLLPGLQENGLYDVRLQTKGPVFLVNNEEQQCKNTLLKKKYIQVDSVSVPEFANVFSPPDKPNDIFYFVNGKKGDFQGAKSVRNFSIKIYSRWGDKVYDYKGDINKWQGWDGTTLGNIVAKTGVYFYSAFIKGWDGKDHNKRGAIHLFRDDN